MYLVTVAALVVGLALLVIGYRKHHRNLLAASALLLLVAGGGQDFIEGFRDGVQHGRVAATDVPAAQADTQ